MYNNKKIFILGMARSGYEVAKVLSKYDSEIIITDKFEQNEEQVLELKALGINLIITDEPEDLLTDQFDYVVKNPGIRLNHPVCLKANELNIPVINELEVAYNSLPSNTKIIGITGSNGKTTTTTITYEILKKASLPVHLGGNIGFPMCSILNKVKENEIIVLELSAQQLHDFKDFKVDIGILTNLVPVHLDHFNTYEFYIENKRKIFNNSSLAILNKDDLDSMNLNIECDKKYFSINEKTDIYIENGFIMYNENPIISLSDIKIKGMHNYQNIMCAIMIAKEFNISDEIIKSVLESFLGVEHRLEFVKKINEREFYNDSKATNVKSTTIALNSFDKPTILLLGGLDRHHSFDELIEYLTNTKLIICYGETKERIKEFSDNNNIECHITENLKDATLLAYDLSVEGDIILLSPACASWDQYKCFEDRGNEFKDVVERIV